MLIFSFFNFFLFLAFTSYDLYLESVISISSQKYKQKCISTKTHIDDDKKRITYTPKPNFFFKYIFMKMFDKTKPYFDLHIFNAHGDFST